MQALLAALTKVELAHSAVLALAPAALVALVEDTTDPLHRELESALQGGYCVGATNLVRDAVFAGLARLENTGLLALVTTSIATT